MASARTSRRRGTLGQGYGLHGDGHVATRTGKEGTNHDFNYAPTATDMVRQIQSIIQSYGDNGPIRRLLKNLCRTHSTPNMTFRPSRVEYRLHRRESRDGETYHLLTVTDSGTYGLRGSALSQTELSERDYELEEDENWAAFEGQGFTKKSNDSARGSRGQGKSAFLYHSLPPAAPGRRRMICCTIRGWLTACTGWEYATLIL